MDPRSYCLIGAGPSGLAAARWLKALDVPFEGFERNPDVGGIWDISFAGSPMYESAHFISSRTLSGFRDFEMSSSYPDYPSHRQVLEYLRSYALHHDLRRYFSFDREVREARRLEGGWRVTFAGGEAKDYAGLIAAVGCEWRPFLPEIPGKFDGQVIHSRDYKTSEEFRGKRVLIVGGGNSGCDIACDASRTATRAFISLRRGYHFVPKFILGKPADVFEESGPRLPYAIERPLLHLLLRVLNGDVTRLGLPKPDHAILESHPVMNTQILHALGHGDLSVKPDVRELQGRDVVFVDGTREAIDLVVLATGFVRGVPFLEPGLVKDDDVSDLFLNVFHRREPSLHVIGHFTTDGGAYPLVDRQAELVARVIDARRSGRSIAPFDRASQSSPPDLSGGIRYQAVRRMSNYVKSRVYRRHIDRILGAMK